MKKSTKIDSLRRIRFDTLSGEEFEKFFHGFLNENIFLMTVVAGRFLASGELTWGQWANHQEFRRLVFNTFETRNLSHIDSTFHDIVKSVVRIVALVAPMALTVEQVGKVAECIGEDAVHVETCDRLRVIPDLFADFLVYDTCFDPDRRNTTLIQRVMKQFSAAGPAMLRNLAESNWIAKVNGITNKELTRALIENYTKRFIASRE